LEPIHNKLLIFSRFWKSISMDFIKQLPESEGFTDILVVVDHLTKQTIFVSTYKTLDAKELAILFMIHIFLKHGCHELP